MKALVVGLGSMGRKRVPILLEQGVAVCGADTRADRRENAEKAFGIRTFGSFEQGLETKPDILVACNMPHEHLPYVKFGLENGMHSFSEENCVSDFALMDEVVKLAKEKPSTVAAPSCSMRYHPCIQRIKQLIDGGRLGPKEGGFVTYHGGSYLPDWHTYENVRDYYAGDRASGGGRDMIPFEYQWLHWIFGDVKSVFAKTKKYGAFDADIFDTYHILSEFVAGNTAQVTVDVLTRWSNRYFRYVTERGEIYWDFNSHFVNVHEARDNRWEMLPEAPISGPYKGWNQMDMYRDEVRHFLDAVKGNTKYCTGYENEKHLNQIALAAEKSSETNAGVAIGG